MVSVHEPARAANRTAKEISRRGAVFNVNEGIVVHDGVACETRLVGWPGNGTRMVSFHVLTHHPGGAHEDHGHPISEESLICIRGEGQVDLGRGWVDVAAGNAIFVPAGSRHATRNRPGSDEDFVVLSYNCPPPMELYKQVGLIVQGMYDQKAIDKASLLSVPGSIPAVCSAQLNDLGGDERGELKGFAETARTGGVFNLFRGARFTGYGALMRFILWPGIGAKNIGQHMAFHDPGIAFAPHVHPISEDAIYCVSGRGQGYLESRWIDVSIGDIIYAPAGVRHGTGCRADESEVFLCTGCASPPQFDLYELAGYLKDGEFGGFEFL
jgi:quercetin dioxygenase-like cupin family protein